MLRIYDEARLCYAICKEVFGELDEATQILRDYWITCGVMMRWMVRMKFFLLNKGTSNNSQGDNHEIIVIVIQLNQLYHCHYMRITRMDTLPPTISKTWNIGDGSLGDVLGNL